MRLDQAVEKFLNFKKLSGLDDDYLKHYIRELHKLVDFTGDFNIIEFSDVNIDHIHGFLGTFTKDGQRSRAATYIKKFYEYYEITENYKFPWRILNSRKPKSKPYKAMPYEVFIHIDKCFEDGIKATGKKNLYKYRAMHHVLWCTGCRRSELLVMELKEINWITREFKFEAGKGNGTRLGKFFTGAEVVKKYLEIYQPTERLFECSDRNVQEMYDYVKDNFGIGLEMSPHCYRAGLITWLLVDKEMPLIFVRDYIKHADINTTAKYSRNEDRKIYNKIGEAFIPVKSGQTILKFGKKELELGFKLKG